MNRYQENNPQIIHAIQLANQGQLSSAQSKLENLHKILPENNFLIVNLAMLSMAQNLFAKVAEYLDQFMVNDENQYPEFYFNATNLYSQSGHYSKAVKCAQKLCQNFPDNLDALILLANSCFEGRDLTLAKNTAQQVIDRFPEHIEMNLFLAKLAIGSGEFEKAEQYYQKVFSLQPTNPYACAGLSKCRKFTKENFQPYLALFQNALKGKHEINNEAAIHFAIAKIYNDIGEYQQAWNSANKANTIQTQRIPFHIGQYQQYIDELLHTYQNSKLLNYNSDNLKKPILIVGMPRSGTTLLEQILSLDTDLYPGGEMKGIDFAVVDNFGQSDFLDCINNMTTDLAGTMATSYQYYYQQFCNFHGHRIIDKVPSNYLYLGLFKAMYPEIRIINIHRDPRDVMVSIFFENFNAKFNYTNNIEDIICVYHQYQKLMAYWNQVMPENILNVEYEQLVYDHDAIKKQIINFCDLNIDDKMDYKNAQNIVNTPSSWQVRQKIYSGSIKRWHRYENLLEPYLTLLER